MILCKGEHLSQSLIVKWLQNLCNNMGATVRLGWTGLEISESFSKSFKMVKNLINSLYINYMSRKISQNKCSVYWIPELQSTCSRGHPFPQIREC